MTQKSSTARRAPRVFRAVVRWGSRLLFTVMVAGVVGIVAVLLVIPRATGGAALTVLTGSMTPGIRVGSVVVTRPVDPGTLRVGDVATYQVAPDEDAYITHRVVAIDDSTSPATFTFKGDANRGADTDPVSADAIRGEVWFHVPYLGTARDTVQGLLKGKAGLSLLAVLLLGGYALSQLVAALRDARRKEPEGADAAEAAEQVLTIDRPAVVATFATARLGEAGLDARTAAREWDGLVAAEDGETATLFFTPEPDLLPLLIDVLELHDPVDLLVRSGPLTVGGAERAQDAAAVPTAGRRGSRERS